MSSNGFLNCYERDELEQMEESVYEEDEDDYDIRERYYPETLPR
jgi:hypothetical protein